MLTYAPTRAVAAATPAPPGPEPAAAGAPPPQALARYRSVDLESRVASASPHMLVLMLFERLQRQLQEARSARIRDDRVARCRAIERALALVDGLDTTLDDRRGGSVAASLHASYALIRARIVDGSPVALEDAEAMVASLADAWRRIAPAGR
jgi:flagellar protein FliS